jgi:hypothetical protein
LGDWKFSIVDWGKNSIITWKSFGHHLEIFSCSINNGSISTMDQIFLSLPNFF